MMPLHVNNVDMTVNANGLFGMTSMMVTMNKS